MFAKKLLISLFLLITFSTMTVKLTSATAFSALFVPSLETTQEDDYYLAEDRLAAVREILQLVYYKFSSSLSLVGFGSFSISNRAARIRARRRKRRKHRRRARRSSRRLIEEEEEEMMQASFGIDIDIDGDGLGDDCDGLDNDCDGIKDNNCGNGLDNDCDGIIEPENFEIFDDFDFTNATHCDGIVALGEIKPSRPYPNRQQMITNEITRNVQLRCFLHLLYDDGNEMNILNNKGDTRKEKQRKNFLKRKGYDLFYSMDWNGDGELNKDDYDSFADMYGLAVPASNLAKNPATATWSK